jgi:hypothetical protein
MTLVGAFVLYRDSKTVRFRDALDMADYFLTSERLQKAIEGAVATADQHLPSLMKVLNGTMRPADALQLVVRYPLESVLERANDTLDD